MDEAVEAELRTFENQGFILIETPKDILDMLNKKADEIKKDFTKATPFNKYLAGNLRYEFLLEEVSELNTFVVEVIRAYESNFDYMNSIRLLSKDVPLQFGPTWINFMKKHEFNPPHMHNGVYSYVLWLDIPYDIEDEKNAPSSINSNHNYPGHFGFIYTSILGETRTEELPVDRTWNGTLCLFPAKLYHFVNPFTTSDEYRITVAGNIMLDVGK